MKNIFCLLLILISSCIQRDPNKSIDEGKVEAHIYTSEEIGWTIEIPKGWNIVDKETKQKMTEKGYNHIRETIGEDIDYSGLKNLIAFNKNQSNMFQSTSEPFDTEYDGEWEENNKAVKEIMYITLLDQGIKVDSTATIIEKIDNLDFHFYTFTIYSPQGKIILNQIMYSRLINGFDFGVSISYNNNKDKEEMLNAFKASKFKKN